MGCQMGQKAMHNLYSNRFFNYTVMLFINRRSYTVLQGKRANFSNLLIF